MIKRFTLVLIFLFSLSAKSQIILTQDTTVCGNYVDTLQAIGSIQDSISGDDDYSGLIQIGFPFTFYGNTYTSLVVCDNGYLTFDAYQANNTNSGWSIDPFGFAGGQGAIPYLFLGSFPNADGPNNAIMAPFHDVCLNGCQTCISPGGSGSVYISNTGIFPNRQFIATWCSAAMYSCYDSLNTFQIVLHEGSNKIETFIDTKQSCSWDGGYAIHGLVDATSTNFNIVTDPLSGLPRNYPLLWTASNEGWEFLPNGLTAYTINQIPFALNLPGVATWTDVNGTILGTGSTLPINISTTTTYYANLIGSCASGILVDSITITVSGGITSLLSSIDATCLGNDATLTVTPDTNTTSPPWNMQLMDANGNIILFQNNVWSSHTFTNLFPGTYSVNLVEPITGCSGVNSIVVKQVHIDLSFSAFSANVSCFDGNDGYISVYTDSGYPPYQFFIDGVFNTNPPPYDTIFNNLTEGTYILSVMDTVNCMMRDTVTITQPTYPLQARASSKALTCYGEDEGIAVVKGVGGTPPYSYTWYNSGQVSFSNNASVTGLHAGSYFAEVTDANGCDTFAIINVIQPQTPLTASIQIMDVACKGNSTGFIVATAAGSYAPYYYVWLVPDTITGFGWDTLREISPPVNVTKDSLNTLHTGSYELHIYDAWGCFVSYSNMVMEPSIALTSSLTKINDVDCFGDSTGQVQVIVSGGVPAYSYIWDDVVVSSPIVSNLNAGLHTIWITDDWGCVIEDTISINENALIEDSIIIIQNVSCYGANDGAVSITSTGGILSHSYDWSTGDTGTIVTGLLFGSYYVIIEDQLGCRVVDSVFISEPDVLETEASMVAHVTCFGFANGIATAVGIGGTIPYTFNWTPGGQTGDTANGLTPVVHTVTLMDAKGCIAIDTVTITQPTELLVQIDPSLIIHPYCTGISSASLTAIASGGTPNYSYEWDDNLVIPQTTATATALAAGIYTITVTDSRGCIATDTEDISTYTNAMTATIEAQLFAGNVNVSCFGANDGMVIVSTWGAHAPYTYQWFGPNNYPATTDTIDNLFAGAYSVTIEDTNGCLINRYINLTEPDLLQFTSYLSTNETCLGACNGTVSVEILGGSYPYYGIATENISGNIITSSILADTITFPAICSGNYTIVVTDANNCPSNLQQGGMNQQSISTSDTTIAQINSSAVQHLICYGIPTGVLSVQNPMAAPNYSYSWEDLLGNVVSADTIADSLLAQTYVLLAHYSDSNGAYPGCTNTDTITISQTDEIMVNATVNATLCYGQSSGSISTAVSGGTPNFTYSWSPNSQTSSNINNLSAGTYSVDISDNNNCYKTDTYTVGEPTVLVVSITQNGNQLVSTVSGGTPNYSYQWNSGQTSHNIIANQSGAYSLTITDANGCVQASNTIMITAIVTIETKEFTLYPNPFKQETLLEFGQIKDMVSIKIFDVCGNVLETHEIKQAEQFTIKRGNKASGIYFLEVKMDGETLHKRLVIQ